jgi:hypothetical protein
LHPTRARARRRDGREPRQNAALSPPAEFSAVSSLGPEIAAQIRRAEEDADSARCNGCRAAILMTHLRCFTARSRYLSAQEVIALLAEDQFIDVENHILHFYDP